MTQTFSEELETIQTVWANCEACELSVRRKAVEGPVVFGTGSSGGIMFIGEGPGKTEEEKGKPFVGVTGKLLKRTIKALGLTRVFLSNIVACRSCEQRKDDLGRPMYITQWDGGKPTNTGEPLMEDMEPTIPCVSACLPRLYWEIRTVDPVLLVALGANAARAVTGIHNLTITNRRGEVIDAPTQGAWMKQVLTEKKGAWLHKVRGEWVQPVVPNIVGYSTLLTFHPSYVHRNSEDHRPGNPTQRFVEDMVYAKRIYVEYQQEALGIQPLEHEVPEAVTDIHTETGEELKDVTQ